MLFAPDTAMLQIPHPQWNNIKTLAPHLLTKKSASFINYCKQQAHKYCLKGARLATARCTLEALREAESRYGSSAKLSCALDILKRLASDNEFISLGTVALSSKNESLYFEICGKKALLSASIKSARLITQKIIDEYGQRTLAAESCDGADWKALSHAVRVGYQAIEFLKHHHMTFPRPEAAHLLAIRKGEVAFQQVVEEIEQLVKEVELVAECSKLPEMYDQQLIDDFIEQLYLEQVLKGNVHDT